MPILPPRIPPLTSSAYQLEGPVLRPASGGSAAAQEATAVGRRSRGFGCREHAVGSSKVTVKVPRSPAKNSSIVAALPTTRPKVFLKSVRCDCQKESRLNEGSHYVGPWSCL